VGARARRVRIGVNGARGGRKISGHRPRPTSLDVVTQTLRT